MFDDTTEVSSEMPYELIQDYLKRANEFHIEKQEEIIPDKRNEIFKVVQDFYLSKSFTRTSFVLICKQFQINPSENEIEALYETSSDDVTLFIFNKLNLND